MKKKFNLFLIINAILWILVDSLRNIISRDSMEAIAWGDLISLGTNKHPPLSGWLASGFYNLFFEHNIGIYILGSICIVIGLIFTYKLAKFFLTKEKAICSSLILTTCFYYSYQVFYDNFNCNIISMALWPMLSYYFYKSLKFNKIKHWILFGLIAGLSFLAKYQVAFLFLGMFLYLIICKKEAFKQKGMYISILVGSIIILPHTIWMFQQDFFPMIYFSERTKATIYNSIPEAIFGRIMFCVKFYLDQLLALAPTFVLYLILAFKEKNISIRNIKEDKDNSLFLLLIGLLPILLIGSSGLINASRVVGAWGATMVGYFGIMLFYFFPIKFKENTFNFFYKWIIGIMIAWQIAMALFASFQTKIDMAYPYKEIMADFDNIWAQNTNNKPLKYVYGNIDYVFQFNMHNSQKPTVILETYEHKNPWINEEDVLNSGILVIGRNEKGIKEHLRQITDLVPLNKNAEIKKYSFEIPNKFNQKSENEFYYAILKPEGLD